MHGEKHRTDILKKGGSGHRRRRACRGFSDDRAWSRQRKKKLDIDIVSDIELFIDGSGRADCVAITGSNGKSTVATLSVADDVPRRG